ncbi:hypothetical protein NDU88_003632 [Pleurodeles waltl]|uniref:Uncharacterized protein n=1 Tax=Pleurodeles waltl TaxID=8319 RepID=A0AAV7T6R5_PLEWA|nr:hypothetical protein NDU88_003632 [Pleurodeles waltl]
MQPPSWVLGVTELIRIFFLLTRSGALLLLWFLLGLKPELEEEERRKRSNSTMESLTGSRGDAMDERGAAAQWRDSPGAKETPQMTEEPKHNTGIQRPAPAAREAPSEYSGHA